MEKVNLGQLLEGGEQRDAVHIAIAPVTAAESLFPGAPIGFTGDGDKVSRESKPIGVVDPFLASHVKEGQRFYMLLFPNTITGLRHLWSHPAFGSEVSRTSVVASEQWLRTFASEWGFDYGEMIRTALQEDAGQWGRYITAQGRDLHGAGELGEDLDLFWGHLQNMTGKVFSKEHKDGLGWSCSC